MVSKVIRVYTGLVSKASLAGGAASGVLIFSILLLVCIEVFGRNFFNYSTTIVDEMSGYMNAVLIFLGAAYSLNSKSFIRVEFLFNRVPKRLQRFLKWINCILCLLCLFILNIYLWKHFIFFYTRKVTSLTLTQTPLYIPLGLMSLGALILFFMVLGYLLNRVHNMP